MKTYGQLDLAKIRDAAGLDFAHFTYQRGMCSCCYGPMDLPKLYWKGHEKPAGKQPYEACTEHPSPIVKNDEYTYLLFKNADNGSGIVHKNDAIHNDYIEWGFPMDRMPLVCSMLQEQLGDDYIVEAPADGSHCIKIILVNQF